MKLYIATPINARPFRDPDDPLRPVLRRWDGTADYLSCLERHVDANGLIGKGLAVPAEKVVDFYEDKDFEE